MIGLSTNYLSDIERGKSSARLDKLVAIINALSCPQPSISLVSAMV
ncbi:MAG: helix-turn-helix domain-containing protein [Christensenellales bacterium]